MEEYGAFITHSKAAIAPEFDKPPLTTDKNGGPWGEPYRKES
jgi:hypothetical protein